MPDVLQHRQGVSRKSMAGWPPFHQVVNEGSCSSFAFGSTRGHPVLGDFVLAADGLLHEVGPRVLGEELLETVVERRRACLAGTATRPGSNWAFSPQEVSLRLPGDRLEFVARGLARAYLAGTSASAAWNSACASGSGGSCRKRMRNRRRPRFCAGQGPSATFVGWTLGLNSRRSCCGCRRSPHRSAAWRGSRRERSASVRGDRPRHPGSRWWPP